MKKMNQTELNRWIGTQIYKERIAQKISQESLSEEVGVSRHFISMLENGNRGAKIDTYYSIAYTLGISLCELFRVNEETGTREDILLLLSDCSAREILALTEILRVSKTQLALIQNQ